ncbi:5'-nucleotidase [Oleiphilus messinensis]|uniref:5'-nucleotidase n=1 Tax=Oleiphilus messinensis TaxID=141451 RepID=A0A1Y0IEG0_9GAMM|nr:5'-nucleotidase C-terminal domain-containing protein [Oleiphilus messinensis]ARU58917.1 5'-nucleotidase [Oleiphilus messinensis]
MTKTLRTLPLLLASAIAATAQADCNSDGFDNQQNTVINAYMAYYGRTPDVAGLSFWSESLAASNGDLAAIIQDFGNSEEFTRNFGTLDDETLINNLYQQAFGRDAESDGLAFYRNELATGAMTLQDIALAILTGAQNEDLQTVSNRRAAAQHYLNAAVSADIELPEQRLQGLLGDITTQAGTVTSACDNITALVDKTVNDGMSLTVLHMNDHHSHLPAEDFDLDVSGLGLSTTTEAGEVVNEITLNYGGFPMMVNLFDMLSNANDNVLKIHAGDAITGTLYYTLFNGAADAEMMNQICFDAFALGNHEFDGGDSGLAAFLDELNKGDCQTPTLAANVVPGANSAIREGYIQPYVIKEVNGQQIGLIGIDIAQKTKESSRPDADTAFLDEAETSQKYIDELTAMGVDKIVLITHYQYQNDIALAESLSGVDVIVGGDSHTLLGDETFSALGFNPVGDYPTVTTNKDGETVCIVQAWEYAHIMGKLDVTFDGIGRVQSCGGHPYMPIEAQYSYEHSDSENRMLEGQDMELVSAALTAHDEIMLVTPNADTSALIAGYDNEVDVLKQTVIGSVADNLCLERFPGQARSSLCDAQATYANGSDISNVVAKAFMTVTPTADIAIQNGGGVRVDVAAGDYTIADAFTLLPFSNTLVTLDMTGQQIVDVLEDALANTLDNGGSSGSYPYASGLRYNVDASQTQGNRISNVEVNPRVESDWQAINLTATYTVVTNDFIASGQDGYDTFGTVFSAGLFVDTFTEYAQGFVDYVQRLNAEGASVTKLPIAEYSTQRYIGTDGCDHSLQSDCEGF